MKITYFCSNDKEGKLIIPFFIFLLLMGNGGDGFINDFLLIGRCLDRLLIDRYLDELANDRCHDELLIDAWMN